MDIRRKTKEVNQMNLNNYIYDTVPEEVDTGYSSESRNWLRGKFMNKPNTLLKSPDLQKECGFKTNVAMRKVITELIEIELLPIVATNRGYTLTTCKDDIDVYIKSLESRQKGIQRRIDALYKTKNKING